MQQRQLRLGDILDDYCPRERRVTNHAVVAMVGDSVKQTRCTTCDAEHEYKHAKIPRQRKKSDTPAALYAQVANGAPKRVVHEALPSNGSGSHGDEDAHVVNETVEASEQHEEAAAIETPADAVAQAAAPVAADDDDLDNDSEPTVDEDEGPIHRRLIRASLPRPEGQQPPARPIPEFTIRQPGGGRPNRFRHRRGPQGQQGHQFHGGSGGNRPAGNMGGPMRGPRPNAGRPGMKQRHGGHGRKRSK